MRSGLMFEALMKSDYAAGYASFVLRDMHSAFVVDQSAENLLSDVR
jgi:hypothetical protein